MRPPAHIEPGRPIKPSQTSVRAAPRKFSYARRLGAIRPAKVGRGCRPLRRRSCRASAVKRSGDESGTPTIGVRRDGNGKAGAGAAGGAGWSGGKRSGVAYWGCPSTRARLQSSLDTRCWRRPSGAPPALPPAFASKHIARQAAALERPWRAGPKAVVRQPCAGSSNRPEEPHPAWPMTSFRSNETLSLWLSRDRAPGRSARAGVAGFRRIGTLGQVRTRRRP